MNERLKLRTILILIIVLGMLLRFYLFLNVPLTNPDGLFYSWIGINLANGHGLTIAEGESLYSDDLKNSRAPLSPIALALSYKIAGTGFYASKIPSMFFGIAIIFLIYLIGKKFGTRVGIVSALFVSLNLLLAIYSAEIMSEGMYTFFLLLYVYFLFSSNHSTKYSFIAGVFAGLSYLTRMVGLSLVPVSLFYYLYVARRVFYREMAFFFLGFVLVVPPWWTWSYAEYGTPFAPETSTAIYQFFLEFWHTPEEELPMLTYLLLHHDFSTLLLGVFDGLRKTASSVISSLSIIGLLLVFVGVISRRFEGRRDIDLALLLIVLLGVSVPAWQVHLISFKESRYIVPYMPFLTLYLAFGLVRIYEWRNKIAPFIFFGCSLVIAASSVSMISQHVTVVNELVQEEYEYVLINLPEGASLLVSNTRVMEKLGYENIYPLADADFDKILSTSGGKEIQYIIVDSSSVYNDDQLYMVTGWYSRVPERLKKVKGNSYHVTLYKVSYNI